MEKQTTAKFSLSKVAVERVYPGDVSSTRPIPTYLLATALEPVARRLAGNIAPNSQVTGGEIIEELAGMFGSVNSLALTSIAKVSAWIGEAYTQGFEA